MARSILGCTYTGPGRGVAAACRNATLAARRGLTIGGWACAFAACLAYSASLFPAEVPTYAAVRAAHHSSEALLVDRHGNPLSEFRVDRQGRRLQWVTLDEVSPALRDALITAEDKRFYEHSGVDWRAFAGALWDNAWRNGTRGASTLSMQLAGLLDPALKPQRGHRGLAQKWSQAQAARELERTWSKPQILEAYLNLVGFRGELSGIGAASRALFGKHPNGLGRAEAMLLVALLRAPNASVDAVAQRACALARGLASDPGAADCAQLNTLAYARLSGGYVLRPSIQLAPHLAARRTAKPGQRVRTTLDAGIQRAALDALKRHLLELAGRNVDDGAVLVLDNASGEVRAYVGSSAATSDAAQVDGVMALRQAGSTLKPFLYGLALERRLLTPASILDDTPLDLATASGLYIPRNYERDFKGQVSLRTALASSLNIPAVRTALLTGLEPFHRKLNAFGFDSIAREADFYGFALALGSADVSLWELTNAYRALANQGVWSPVRFIPGAGGGAHRALDAGAAYLIADILADRSARALTFGLENALATRGWAAVKTGTSKDMRDNWCIGFTDRYTVGVWVGNFTGAPMWGVSGVSGAAPIWQELVQALSGRHPARARPAPRGVVLHMTHYAEGIEPDRQEWFLTGTESEVQRAVMHDRPRIAYPPSGTIIAIDPDIPAARQRVFFSMRPLHPELAWELDGAPVAEAAWRPLPGRHQLTLINADGTRVDKVSFEVRGEMQQAE